MLRKTTFAFVLLALLLGMSSAAFAQKSTKVVRVVVLKTDNVAAYLEALDNGTEIMKKLGVNATTHAYRATFAGPEAGAIVVTIEFPNMAAFADYSAKIEADKDYQAWLKDLAKIRTIISDSIYRELR